MITKQERDELLSEAGLSEDELRMVFAELGVDYDASSFEENIIEQVEATAQVMGLAVNEVKRLNAAKPMSQSSEIITQQIGEVMFASLEQQGISLSPETILTLAQSKAEQYIELSDRIHELAQRIYAARETLNTTAFTQRLLNQAVQEGETIELLLDDDAQRQIIDSLTPQAHLNGEVASVRKTLESKAKARNQIAAQKEQAITQLPSQDPKAFVRQFLAARREG